jgi:hypothetical protein
MMRLEQRKWTERRSFAIDGAGLQVEEKTLFSRMRYSVPFEAIPDETFSIASSSRRWFGLAIAAGAAAVLHLLFLALIPVFAGLWWSSRRSYVGLRCGRQLVLFHDVPAVPPFIDELQLRKMLYLRQRYAHELDLPDLAQA